MSDEAKILELQPEWEISNEYHLSGHSHSVCR